MRKAREGRQSQGQGYSEFNLGSKAKRNSGKSHFERRALKRTNVHNPKGDNQGFIPKTVGTETNPAGDLDGQEGRKGSRLEKKAAEAKWTEAVGETYSVLKSQRQTEKIQEWGVLQPRSNSEAEMS